jgi:hypothetical protein
MREPRQNFSPAMSYCSGLYAGAHRFNIRKLEGKRLSRMLKQHLVALLYAFQAMLAMQT